MANGVFIGVGHNGVCLRSDDGQQWTQTHTGKEGEIFKALCFGDGRCVAAGSYGGDNLFGTTRDGTTWQTFRHDAGYSRYVRGLVHVGGAFIGLGGDGATVGAGRPFETHTADGAQWSEYNDITGGFLLRRAAFGNGKVVAVGDRGRRAVSPDGLSAWADAPDARPLDTLVDVAFGNGVFVGVGLNGLRMRTRDGLTWTDKQRGEEGEHINSILWTGQQFAAIGSGATYFSSDGQQWQRQPNQNAPVTAAFGSGVYVGARWRGRLLASPDAITWKEVYKCPSHIEAIGFGPFA